MKKIILATCALALGAIALPAQTIIAHDWQFNTLGDDEGWTASRAGNLDVRAAVSGSETVLSTVISGSNADAKLFNPAFTAPANFLNWNTLTYRFRQIDGDPTVGGTAPKAYDGTANRFDFPGWGFISGDLQTAAASDPDVTFTVEPSGEWIVFSVDVSSSTNPSIGASNVRLDPISVLGEGFEVDYVTLTADVVPEPSAIALFLGAGALGFAVCRRRRHG